MRLPPFLLDRWLAKYEFASPPIRYNLASSTGPSWTLDELSGLGGGSNKSLGELRLAYAPPEGSRALREQIAKFHGVDPEWVIAMTGASEALLTFFGDCAEPGASIVLPKPMYPAMAAVARIWGFEIDTYLLDRNDGFAQTADRVLASVSDKTKLVVVNTPHNPTGAVMPIAAIERLAAALAERGIPVLVDEVYHPLYFYAPSSSAAGIPNTVVVGDLSKALSLPALRIGWIIDRDAQRRERLIDLRSYFTISCSPLTEAIAAHALEHNRTILARLETVTRANLSLFEEFMLAHTNVFGWAAPAGGPVAFPWLLDGSDTRSLCERLAREGVLMVPGDCFDAPAHIRIGFGAQIKGFSDALGIVSRVLSAGERR